MLHFPDLSLGDIRSMFLCSWNDHTALITVYSHISTHCFLQIVLNSHGVSHSASTRLSTVNISKSTVLHQKKSTCRIKTMTALSVIMSLFNTAAYAQHKWKASVQGETSHLCLISVSVQSYLLWTCMSYQCAPTSCWYFKWSINHGEHSIPRSIFFSKIKKTSRYKWCGDFIHRKQQDILNVELLYNTTQWVV